MNPYGYGYNQSVAYTTPGYNVGAYQTNPCGPCCTPECLACCGALAICCYCCR